MILKKLVLVVLTGFALIPKNGYSAESLNYDYTIKLPGKPFFIASTPDDSWLFVSLADNKKGALAILKNTNGRYAIDHVIPLENPGYGEAISRDGNTLLIAAGDYIQIFDVQSLINGKSEGAATISAGKGAGSIYAKISNDNKFAFVSEERLNQVFVISLDRLKDGDGDKSIISRIPTGISPVGLDLSPDGKILYITSEVLRGGSGENLCQPENGKGKPHPEGVVMRVDIARSILDPRRAITGLIRAGCNPVRVAMSQSGKNLWVTARDSNSILRIPEGVWANTKSNELVHVYQAGPSPVGIAVRSDDSQVWVSASNRFGQNDLGSLEGLIFKDSESEAEQLKIENLNFPRDLSFLHDNRTLAFTIFNSDEIGFYKTPE